MAVKDVKIYLMMLTLTAYVIGLSFNAFFVSGLLSTCRSSKFC
jgi:multisubunit Na+/H+ antiporter MnhC subunit